MTFAAKSMTGTGVYAQQLKAAVTASGRFDIQTLSAPIRKTSPLKMLNGARNIAWLQFGLPARLNALQADLVHEAAFVGTLHAPCPMVVNVLDTTFLTFPEDFDYKWRLYARFWIGPTVRRAAAVITLSEFARDCIVEAYQIPPERVHVVYPGIEEQFRPVRDLRTLDGVRAKYGLSADYILFVGAVDKRKNVVTLVEAFARLKTHERMDALQLVLAGPRARGSAEVAAAIARAQLGASVVQLGYVPSGDLPLLYAGARLLAFPSRMEGFGLPLIEAMACGTPVVAVPYAPVQEVVDDSALIAASLEPDALVAALQRVLCDDELARSLRAKGLERSRRFSWTRAGDETCALYDRIIPHRLARKGA
jgi:glycosyltransferase involved in cell wall biosynthesis